MSPKGLDKANKSINHFKKGIKHVKDWNNSPLQLLHFSKLISIYTLRLFNVEFKDLGITEFKAHSIRTNKSYVILLMVLFLEGKLTRTRLISSTNLDYATCSILLNQMLEAGYLSPCVTKRRNNIKGQIVMKAHNEIQLTSKGYDLLLNIFALLIDLSVLEPDKKAV